MFGQSIVVSDCPKCGGRGQTYDEPCPACRGRGRINKTSKVQVRIPAGVEDGNRMRVPGAGDAGVRGGPPGDLYVFIRVRDDPRFERSGMNLHTAAEATYPRLVLGGPVTVKNLEGKNIEINVPAGTQVGEVLRVPGQGVPELNHPERRGNLYVHIGITIPKKASAFEKELLQKLDEGAGPKKGSKKGVFGKK